MTTDQYLTLLAALKKFREGHGPLRPGPDPAEAGRDRIFDEAIAAASPSLRAFLQRHRSEVIYFFLALGPGGLSRMESLLRTWPVTEFPQ